MLLLIAAYKCPREIVHIGIAVVIKLYVMPILALVRYCVVAAQSWQQWSSGRKELCYLSHKATARCGRGPCWRGKVEWNGGKAMAKPTLPLSVPKEKQSCRREPCRHDSHDLTSSGLSWDAQPSRSVTACPFYFSVFGSGSVDGVQVGVRRGEEG